MEHLEKTVKISNKGQITLPRQVRKLLQADLVRIVAEEGQVRIEPVKDVAGTLKQYAKRYVPIREAKEKAWKRVVDEKHLRS
jgi:bifunctional DNA-binding transcriptional regulator/antitoxin component of YhaV-PrlF toxin-antitoxin module